MLVNLGYRHLLRILNTYRFSIATTRLNVTLYYIACLVLFW